jgi:hypothetical protein
LLGCALGVQYECPTWAISTSSKINAASTLCVLIGQKAKRQSSSLRSANGAGFQAENLRRHAPFLGNQRTSIGSESHRYSAKWDQSMIARSREPTGPFSDAFFVLGMYLVCEKNEALARALAT